MTIDYDPSLAKDILFYSKTSYCPDKSIASWDCKSCAYYPGMIQQEVFYNKSSHAQGYGGYDQENNRIVFSFRGSVDLTNWEFDFDFIKTAYNGCSNCHVHEGFWKTWQDLAPNVIEKANALKLRYPSAKIVVTGHSLGAAVATLCAVKILKKY